MSVPSPVPRSRRRLACVTLGWSSGDSALAAACIRSIAEVGRENAAVPGLAIVQSLLLIPYRMHAPEWLRAVSSLHMLNALLIFWVAFELHHWSASMMAPADGVAGSGDVAPRAAGQS